MKKMFNINTLKISIIAVLTISVGLLANKLQPVQKFLATFSRPELSNVTTVYFQREDKTVFEAKMQLASGKIQTSNSSISPEILVQEDIVGVSKDKNLYAYAPDTDDGQFKVKDRTTNKELIVDNKDHSIQKLSFSPSGEYLIVVSGSSQSKIVNVYETKEYSKYLTLDMLGTDIYWTDDDKFISNYATKLKNPRPWSEGNASGIRYVLLDEKKVETLVTPTETEDFVLTSYEAGKGIITSSFVENETAWSKTPFELKTKFYTLNIASKTMTPLVSPETTSPTEQEILDNLKLDLLPNNIFIHKNPAYPEIVLVTTRTDSSPYTSEIYIVDKNDLSKFQKIGTGMLVEWR